MPFADDNEQFVGRYYTPVVIARLAVLEALRLLRATSSHPTERPLCAIDPACGEGVFLVELLRVLSRDAGNGVLPIELAGESLFGIDRDAAAVSRCRHRIGDEAASLRRMSHTATEFLQQTLRSQILYGDAMTGRDLHPTDQASLPAPHRTRRRRRRKGVTSPEHTGIVPNVPPIDFATAFPQAADQGGFDLVVGNPPYLRERHARGLFDAVLDAPLGRRWSQPRMDFWHFFLHRGLDILRPGGILAYVVSGYWTGAHSASRLIERLQQESAILQIAEFGTTKLFPGVSGRHMLIWLRKGRSDSPCLVIDLHSLNGEIESVISKNDLADESLSQRCVSWLQDEQIPRRVIPVDQLYQNGRLVTREAHVRDIGLSNGDRLGEYFEVRQGIAENPAMISARLNRQYEQHYRVGEGVFVLTHDEVQRLQLSDDERRLLRPYVKAAEIKRYQPPQRPSLWLLYLTRETAPTLNRIPQIARHLRRFRPILDRRREVAQGKMAWWHLHWPRAERIFIEPRIFGAQMARIPTFARATVPLFTGFSVNVILPRTNHSTDFSLPSLQGLLNSRRAADWFDRLAKRRGVNLDISGGLLRQFPLPKPQVDLLQKLDRLVRRQETMSGGAAERQEAQIEAVVDQLYLASCSKPRVASDRLPEGVRTPESPDGHKPDRTAQA